jgi:hypothetical protein
LATRPWPEVLAFASLLLVLYTPFAFLGSSVGSRLALIAALSLLLVSVISAGYRNRNWLVFGILVLTSALFLMYRSYFLMPYYVNNTLNSVSFETYMSAQAYGENPHLVFGGLYSAFFLPSLILHFLYTVCGMSPMVTLYISLLEFGGLIGILGFMIFNGVKRFTPLASYTGERSRVIAAVVAFSVVSLTYSERTLGTGLVTEDGAGLLLMLPAMWLLFSRGLKTWSNFVAIMLLVFGITCTSPDISEILLPFFITMAILSRGGGKENLLYLLPTAYLTLLGSLYIFHVASFAQFAWEGFVRFLQSAVQGQIVESVVPWNRAISLTRVDAVVASLGYLSLILLSLVSAVVSTVTLVKRQTRHEKQDRNLLSSATVCLWLSIIVAGIAYIGTRTRPQTTFSDISTIAIVFVSISLLIVFMSGPFTLRINRSKALCAFLLVLIAFASLRSMYEVYPKSVSDPVNVLEEPRDMYSDAVYFTAKFIESYYRSGEIVGDHNALNPAKKLRLSGQFAGEIGWGSLPKSGILVLSIGAIEHPSMFHSNQTYVRAFGFAAVHNRVYDNGAVMVAWWGS